MLELLRPDPLAIGMNKGDGHPSGSKIGEDWNANKEMKHINGIFLFIKRRVYGPDIIVQI